MWSLFADRGRFSLLQICPLTDIVQVQVVSTEHACTRTKLSVLNRLYIHVHVCVCLGNVIIYFLKEHEFEGKWKGKENREGIGVMQLQCSCIKSSNTY